MNNIVWRTRNCGTLFAIKKFCQHERVQWHTANPDASAVRPKHRLIAGCSSHGFKRRECWLWLAQKVEQRIKIRASQVRILHHAVPME